jgi:hypothetical protein
MPEQDSGGEDAGDGDGDPLAQTFMVQDAGTNTPGAFLSKIDLYFQSKDATDGVLVELRECDPGSGHVTKKMVPLSRVIIPSADINVSNDASAATPVIFSTPVYLLAQNNYAFVVKPMANNPNTTAWTARMGGTDIITGSRVSVQPAIGMLYASSNDRAYSPLQEEDLKFDMYFANFGTSQTGTGVFNNIDKEMLVLDTVSNPFGTAGEEIHGETTLTLSAGITGLSVGDTVTGAAGATGNATFVSGTTVRVKDVSTATKFVNSETITFGSNTATLSSQATPIGKMFYYDATTTDNTLLHLIEPSGTFVANTQIKGQINGYTARIDYLDTNKMDLFSNKMGTFDLEGTTLTMNAKLSTSNSATSLMSTARKVNINDDSKFENRRFILSKSAESGTKSALFTASLGNSDNVRMSPAIDTDRNALITIENLINNLTTNETGTGIGDAKARYVTRTVTLDDGQDAEDMKVFIGAYKPSTATIKAYVKLLHNEDNEEIDDKSYLELTQVTSSTLFSDSENDQDFNEYEFTIPTASLTGGGGSVQYSSGGVTYTGFKHFKVKIVLASSTTSNVPRIRDFRAIALQV